MVITATRTPTPITSATQPVTVLTAADLRARGVSTVADALRQVPGAQVAASGSYGGVTSLFLRGGESRYTKVLIDGVAINATGGQVFLDYLTTDNVERIEITEGPSSALYGADAMAGVIQIFTRRGGGPATIDADVRGGTYGSRDATLSARGGDARGDYSIGAGWHATNGTINFNNDYDNGTLSGGGDRSSRRGYVAFDHVAIHRGRLSLPNRLHGRGDRYDVVLA